MLIALNGAKSAGKDAVGAYLVQNHGFTRLSFADLLKQSAAALFDVPVESWDEWKNDSEMKVMIQRVKDDGVYILSPPSRVMTVRSFLQRYGTESHREIFGDNFWVDALLDQEYDLTQRYCITDARFDNELKSIKSMNGVTIRIDRFSVEGGDGHLSEAEPDPSLIDWHIDNNGDLQHLYDGIEGLVNYLVNDQHAA